MVCCPMGVMFKPIEGKVDKSVVFEVPDEVRVVFKSVFDVISVVGETHPQLVARLPHIFHGTFLALDEVDTVRLG